MQEKEFRRIVAKTTDGSATAKETKLLKEFELMQIAANQQKYDLQGLEVKDEIWFAVKPNDTSRFNWAVAAAIAVLVSIGSVFIWFNSNEVVQMQIVQTKVGETKLVVLPDGSTAHLNALSSIQFPLDFEGGKRKIDLLGEAYFDVRHNPQKPFVVSSLGIETVVLGTRFNISSYDSNGIEVSLMEGSVKIEASFAGYLLKPGQKAQFDLVSEQSTLSVSNAENAADYTRNELVLDETTFDDLKEIFARRYGVELNWENEAINDFQVSGKFKNQPPSEIIEVLVSVKGLTSALKAPNSITINTTQL